MTSWHIGRFLIKQLGVDTYSVHMDTVDSMRNATIVQGTISEVLRYVQELKMALGGLEVALETLEAGDNLVT